MNSQECTCISVVRPVARVTKNSEKGLKGFNTSLKMAKKVLLRLGRSPLLFITLMRALGDQEAKMTTESLNLLICVIISA